MAHLTITLESGFVDDSVIVRVGDRVVLEKEGVRTRLLIGFAETVDVVVEPGSQTVSIELPKRGLSRSATVEVADEKAIHFSIVGGRVEFNIFDRPPGFG